MKNANFIAFDFETATMQHAACQLGIAIVKEGEVIKTINRLIQPPKNRYTPQCVAVHGITPNQTADAPTFDVVWNEVKTYFEANFVVAHNLKFDLEVLNKSLQRYNLPHPIFMGQACTYELTGLSLKDACKRYGVPLCSHHDGECDAEACARLFLKYLNGEMLQEKSPSPYHLGERTEETAKLAFYHEQLRGDILKKDLSGANSENPFYDKKVVITGVFEMERFELAQTLKEMGADINTGITKHTEIVLIGEDAGPSKLAKIVQLQEAGIKIRQIFEPELKEILTKYRQ